MRKKELCSKKYVRSSPPYGLSVFVRTNQRGHGILRNAAVQRLREQRLFDHTVNILENQDIKSGFSRKNTLLYTRQEKRGSPALKYLSRTLSSLERSSCHRYIFRSKIYTPESFSGLEENAGIKPERVRIDFSV